MSEKNTGSSVLSPTDFVPVRDAAARLGVHSRTMIRWIREGRLKGTKIGARWKVRYADLDAFVASGRPAVLPQPTGAAQVARVPPRQAATPPSAPRLTGIPHPRPSYGGGNPYG